VSASVGRGTRGGRIFGLQVDSHEKTINKGKYEISQVADRLGIRPREDITGAAHRLYKLAVQRNFTRGRRTQQVAGACLYIVCRQESRPYMLIDFSDVVQTNVYVLGAVFLQLCRLLRLEQHPLISKPIDPSLFIHRFADKLNLNRRMHAVANTALRLVASMKRDWMQTGRRPSGVCGAALWVAALLHGFERSKRDVVAVVHVGEATLRKRVSEFENTPSAFLSVDEFDAKAKEWEKEQAALADVTRGKSALANTDGLAIVSHTTALTCAHKDHDGAAHFAHGMCRACYVEYARVSGGAVGGEDPPAFKAAELKRKKLAQRNLPAASRPCLPEPRGALPALGAPLGAPLGTKKKRLTATQTAAAIAAAAKAAAKHPVKDDDAAQTRDDPSEVKKNAHAEAFLEEEMEKALDSRGHLGEFAVMTGLRARRAESDADGDANGDGDAPTPDAGHHVPTLGVGPEVAEAATALLKRLVGDAHASRYCLPLGRDGRARGRVSGKHLSSQHPHVKRDPAGVARGGRIAEADKTQLHFLVAAGCFDASAVARLKKFSELDIDAMLAAPLPLRRRAAAPPEAAARPAGPDAAAAAAAAAIRAAARESDANHEKTRRDVLRQTAREARAAKQRAAELARAHGVKDPKLESGEAWKGAPAKTEGTADASAATAPEPEAAASESESDASDAEPETFSDVDDDEVADYIHTEEEVKLRRVIWSELNKEYLETQAAKEAATATTTRAGDGDESAGGAKKKRKQYTHAVPADSAAEAAHAMLSSKKISSKINYDALNDLFKQDSLDAAEREARESERTKAERAGRAGGDRAASKPPRAAEDARAPGPPQAPGRLSSRLAGFNPHLKTGEKHAPGLGGGGLGSRLAAAGAGAAAAAAAEKKKGEERRGVVAPRAREKGISAAAHTDAKEKKRGMSDATLAEAAMQSTGRRGGKRGRSTKGADWLS
jgi:transcription factor IIIB subunit 2